MENLPKVSIIIPIYNVEPYIAECLQSVMRQTYQGPLECILVDDCGSDKSMEVAEKLIVDYNGAIEFRILHHEHNRGLSAARNTGMTVAKGDYVYFLDSDDWISNDCIEKLAQPLQQKEFDIVVGDYETIGELPYHLELSLPEGPYHERGITHTFCNGGVYVMAWNKLYRKEFLVKNQLSFEEGKIHEDEILAFELSCIEKSFYVVKSVIYFYRIRANSIVTQQNQLRRVKSYLGAMNGVKEKADRYKNLDGFYDFYMLWQRRVFSWISTIDLDDNQLAGIQSETSHLFDVIPNFRSLKNKHNRFVYCECKRESSYSHLKYVTQVYANQIKGRIVRNLLSIIP